MLLAGKLREGDAIGIFSPSAPVTADAPKRFQRAKAFLTQEGFRLVEGSLTHQKDYYRSGTIAARAEELNSLIRNPEVKCIMSTVGGHNSNAILPYIDFAQLMRTPKIIIGYSDVTAILLGIYAQTGLVTYYGPAFVASLGEFAPFSALTFQYFRDILVTAQTQPFELSRPSFWTDEFMSWEEQERCKVGQENHLLTLCGGKAEGRVIGGNLNTMQGIWGSPYMPDICEGDILFIEDSMKDIATVERSLAFLQINGVFDKIGGIILGKHERFNDLGTGRRPSDVLLEIIKNPSYPILAEFDCSHAQPMLTLPIGCRIQLDATTQRVTLLENWIAP